MKRSVSQYTDYWLDVHSELSPKGTLGAKFIVRFREVLAFDFRKPSVKQQGQNLLSTLEGCTP